MNNYKIRKALVEDVQAIIQMYADDDTNDRKDVGISSSYLSVFTQIFTDPNRELMVLTDYNEDVLGSFQLSLIPQLTYEVEIKAQIDSIVVHKDYKYEELCNRMIAWSIERAEIYGACFIQVNSKNSDEAFISCLNSFGFEKIHQGLKLKLV